MCCFECDVIVKGSVLLIEGECARADVEKGGECACFECVVIVKGSVLLIEGECIRVM